MNRGWWAIAIAALQAAPAFALTDVSAAAGADAPAAETDASFSGVLVDSAACDAASCFSAESSPLVIGEEPDILALPIESGVVRAIAEWLDEPAVEVANAPTPDDDPGGSGGFVLDLESFTDGAALLVGDDRSILLGGDAGLALALLEGDQAGEAASDWASACGASDGGAVAVSLASIATGCPPPPVQYAGTLDATPGAAASFMQNLWSTPGAGQWSSWFYPVFSPVRSAGWSPTRPAPVAAPLRGGIQRFAPPPPATAGFAQALASPLPAASPAPSAAVVPEPASWALLIAGFALVGTAMRRRSPAAAA